MTNARFETRDLATLSAVEAYDLITSFDVVHDLAKPREALTAIMQVLEGDVFHASYVARKAAKDNSKELIMVVIRNVFRLKFWRAREAAALFKEGIAIQKRVVSTYFSARDLCLIAPFSRYTTPSGAERMNSATKARPISSCSIVPNGSGIRRPNQAT